MKALAKKIGKGIAVVGTAETTQIDPKLMICIAGGLVLLLFVSVVWPAIFFASRERRKDARLVLQQLLDFMRKRT